MSSVVLLTTGASICAGVLIDDRGTVATAYHCVASGRRPRVEALGGASGIGRVVAARPREDLAIVEAPDLAGLPGLPLREAPPRIGEEVWALGHPFGSTESRALQGTLRWSASRGIVSAVGDRLIQTDAGVNPGNSGGPLLDAEGRVIGIVSRKLRGDNVAFAAPAEALGALLVERTPPSLFGGDYGLGLTGVAPVELGTAPTVGLEGRLMVRDTLVLSAAAHAPLGPRWVALRHGEVTWVSGEIYGALRGRVGRGPLSTHLDLGGGALSLATQTATFEEDRIYLLPGAPTWRPAGIARLGFGGSALRWVISPGDDGQWQTWLGLDVEWPGTLGIY